jgi:hypothetical protein
VRHVCHLPELCRDIAWEASVSVYVGCRDPACCGPCVVAVRNKISLQINYPFLWLCVGVLYMHQLLRKAIP